MTENIYDTANQLSAELRETDEFKQLEVGFHAMRDDEKSSNLFDEFKAMQVSMQQKQMTGEEITDEDADNVEKLSKKISNDKNIKTLMGYEQELNALINELNGIVTFPIAQLYRSNDAR